MRDALERYYSEPWAIDGLLYGMRDFEPPSRLTAEEIGNESINRETIVVEPCRGGGALSDRLQALGFIVLTGDLDPEVKCHYPNTDLLHPKAQRVYEGCDWIITNPPFSAGPDCVRAALKIARQGVAMLLRLNFLEPCTKDASSRVDLLQKLQHVVVMPRMRFSGAKGTDEITTAWFVWRNEMPGLTLKYRSTQTTFITKEDVARFRGQLIL